MALTYLNQPSPYLDRPDLLSVEHKWVFWLFSPHFAVDNSTSGSNAQRKYQLELGNNIHVVVNLYKGYIVIHIRKFDSERRKKHFTLNETLPFSSDNGMNCLQVLSKLMKQLERSKIIPSFMLERSNRVVVFY